MSLLHVLHATPRPACMACQREARFDARVRALATALPVDAPVNDAMIQAAFDRQVPPLPEPRRWLPMIGAGVGLAAAAVVVLVVLRPPPTTSSCTIAHAVIDDCAGVVETSPNIVSIAPRGAASRTFEVDPAKHAPFRVVTPAFVVDVLGTVFTVTERGVSVARGVVRVSAPDGRVLAARLTAGQRWSIEVHVAATGADTAPAARADAVTSAGDVTTTDPDRADAGPDSAVAGSGTTGTSGTTTPRVDAAKILADARTLIATKQLAAARTKLTALLAARTLTRAQRADAEERLANTYEGAERLRRLTTVADTYRDLPIGEAALGAAARAARGTPEERLLMQRYLERYPSGPLATSFEARL